MKRAVALTQHLAAQGVPGAFTVNRQPRNRNGAVTTVTEMPGGRSECDDLLDVVSVQVRSRGLPEDMQSAIDLADHNDRVMRDDSLWPFVLDGKTVISVQRPGGAPSFLHHDHEQRTTYVCNYRIRIER